MSERDSICASEENPEAWLPVVGWEDCYEVSGCGRVRTLNGRILKSWLNSSGYPLVRLSGPRAVARVHRLVAEAFIPNPHGKPFINHIDCDRANNVVHNLEWCTQAENLRHSDSLGRMQKNYWVGKRSPSATLSNEVVKEIRAAYSSGDGSLASL